MSDVAAATAAQTVQAPPPAASGTSSGPTLWSKGGFSFKDLLDIVNPLQHLPVIGSVYRYLTGDEPSGGARIIGDSLYGGPIGFGVSVVSTALLDDDQGHDLGERMLAKVFGPRDGDANPTATAVASAAPAPLMATATPRMTASQTSAAADPSSAMMANITAPATMPSASGVPSGAHAGGQPVAPPASMNQLFRSVQPSAPASMGPAGPASPEQTFLSQNAQLQRQVANGRGSDGSVINGHGVPLELSSNLLPVMPPGGRLTVNGKAVATPATALATGSTQPTTPAASAAAAQAAASAASAAATGIIPMAAPTPVGTANSNGIAQKMMDALAKYQQLKQQEDQQNSAETGASSPASGPTPRKVDLAL